MPNDDIIEKYTVGGTYTTTNTNWGGQNLDIDAIFNKKATKVKKKAMKKVMKKNKKEKLLYNCDWCGNSFRATEEEVNVAENGGFYCKLQCKIKGKYGESALNRELFELEEEKDVNNVPRD